MQTSKTPTRSSELFKQEISWQQSLVITRGKAIERKIRSIAFQQLLCWMKKPEPVDSASSLP
jgi:hypothetical protein